jgi:glutaconyl-CoA/methylmalonyl-CoA decarboxylase subunit gamma
MQSYRLFIDGVLYEVEIDDPFASPTEVVVNGERFLVADEDQRIQEAPAQAAVSAPVTSEPEAIEAPAPPVRPAAAAAPVAGSATVAAPMPGKVLAINVAVGDAVQAGDSVCTIEAMKMEMAVRATTVGTVREIRVSPGQAVRNAEVLVVLG